ncbi:hypothetical protein BYT27DRAFT_7247740 [Phlegmacium glaucopus]|nr:hypothetical protein BYT27DRAFT_7247740 [Phlegmacium glaucopus]
MSILSESVGSLPRPRKLHDAYVKFDAGELTPDTAPDEACRDFTERMQATGQPTTHAAEYLTLLANGQKSNEASRHCPIYVVSPTPLGQKRKRDRRLRQFEDLVNECEKNIRQVSPLTEEAVRVPINFTEGRLFLKKDPRNPWSRHVLKVLKNRILARVSAA